MAKSRNLTEVGVELNANDNVIIVLFNDKLVKPPTSMISKFSQVGSSTKSVASAMQTKSMRPAEVLCLRCRKFILLALKPSH